VCRLERQTVRKYQAKYRISIAALFSSLSLPLVIKDAFTGILISNASHFVAAIALYQLTYHIIPYTELTKRRTAFAASCLHIISPAGLFLSAPYGESTFAMLNFSGAFSYVLAIKARFQSKPDAMTVAMWTLLAGGCFGLSATIRSNGVLAGLLFAWDAIEIEGSLQPTQLARNLKALRMYAATICAGILVGTGFAAPQVVAYVEYCTGENSRPWCLRLIPSIYGWVQDYYWEVGFLRYWTLNNLPLFLLAGPMLMMLLYTGLIGLVSQIETVHRGSASMKDFDKAIMDMRIYNHVMPRMALQQFILAIMAATSFHVQIINRISSGCPVWYIVLAGVLCTPSSKEHRSHVGQERQPLSNLRFLSEGSNLQWIVRGMVMYAVIQGGLYASFLPPA
jgi:phosphatidylinositol glycan class V